MTAIAPVIRDVLERGVFCHVAASTPLGPHVTPMVFALAADRVWVTTSRGSVKARAWGGDDRVAGLVRDGDRSVLFSGRAVRHDALDPTSWARTVAAAPSVAIASARFTRKNARFFAGYAMDAGQVPFAWTPPGRVLGELSLDRATLIEGDRLVSRGRRPPAPSLPPSAPRFRAVRAGGEALGRLPREIGGELGSSGLAALAIEGRAGPSVLPVGWVADGASMYAVTSEAVYALAGTTTASPRVALAIDRPSTWRARSMLGAMVRGAGDAHVVSRLGSGAASARRIAGSAHGDPDDAVVLRVRPERFVWWRGWESGTVPAV